MIVVDIGTLIPVCMQMDTRFFAQIGSHFDYSATAHFAAISYYATLAKLHYVKNCLI